MCKSIISILLRTTKTALYVAFIICFIGILTPDGSLSNKALTVIDLSAAVHSTFTFKSACHG